MKQDKPHFSAIILAAGYSSRMDGNLKALLPLGLADNMLNMAIKSFQDANIYDIYVVVGHEHKLIENEVKDFSIHIVYNEDFKSGMFSSICAGIKSVMEHDKSCAGINSKITNNTSDVTIATKITNNATNVDIATKIINNATNVDIATKITNNAINVDIATKIVSKSPCAIFILPVDAPLVKSSTIKALAEKWSGYLQAQRILIPIFIENCGHPPLIGNAHFEAIINYESQGGLGGLRGYFASLLEKDIADDFLQGIIPQDNNSKYVDCIPQDNNANHVDCIPQESNSNYIEFIPIIDEGIISDIDTMQKYEQAQMFLKTTCNREHASIAEAWYLLQKSNLPNRVIKHSYAVALGALRLGLALSNNKKIKLEYHICGGILHDIFRTQRDHSLKAKEFLWELGWKDLSYIVGAHTVLPKKILKSLQIRLHEKNVESEPCSICIKHENSFNLSAECQNASICVYLSDKFFSADQFVSMDERFSRVKQRFAHDNVAIEAIVGRELVSRAVSDWFLNETKIRADECVQKESGHKLENQLKALCKI